MPSPSRSGSFLVAVAAVLVQGCSAEGPAPRSCQTRAECSATARCISGACVANAPPSAVVALPSGALEANLLLAFDGSSSADPDAGDAIVSHAWVFRAIAADCAPPAVAGGGPLANVRFGCPGTFAVDLTVTDQLGAPAVATAEFRVAAYSGPALLAIGPDVEVGHVCTAEPARCVPSGSVALSASPTEAAPADLTLQWIVEPPPGRSLDANRRVAFSPASDASSPTVSIETDGQAISGDWIFRVEARDAAGVVASGIIRVIVGNRPPVLTRTLPVPDHRFDGTQLTSFGEVPFTVTDPDGDALVGRTVGWHHVGDGPEGTFTGTVLDVPGRVTFSIVVPYHGPDDAQFLIGGAGLERSIRFSIMDVNGAAAVGVWPIVVGNRPPVLVSAPAGLNVDHFYDDAALAYRAVAPLSTWADPDGDPLVPVPGAGTGDPQCPQLDVVNGTSTASCSLPFSGTPAVANFAGRHLVAQRVQDPWVEAATASTVSFEIGNRPPSITATPVALHVACSAGGCCDWWTDPETNLPECLGDYENWEGATLVVSGRWNDPDGDPLNVTVTGTPSQVCTPSACAVPFVFGGGSTCGSPTVGYATAAGDGAVTASAAITMNLMCP